MPALLLTLVLVGIGWILILRPQQQRLKEQRAMVEALVPGDRVITAGGIHGVLTEVEPETVRIEVAPQVVLTLARPAIARRVDADASPTDPEPTSGRTGEPAEDPVTIDPAAVVPEDEA
ncbi:MAG: preprotein translocase subunit YajC [Acidimicrobiales bacterium]